MKSNQVNGDVRAAANRETPPPTKPVAQQRIGVTNQALIVGVLCAIGGWFLHILSERNERDAALPELPKRVVSEMAPTMVTVAPVSIRSIAQTIEAIGTLGSFEEIPISSKVEGNVMRIHHDVGARVQPGDVLIDIDPENYRLSVEQAERSLQVELAKLGWTEPPPANWDITQTPSVLQAQARLSQAESRWERLQKLSSAKAISEADLDSARSDFETAKAEREQKILMANSDLATIKMKQTMLAIAQRQLRETQIMAPLPKSFGPLVAAGSNAKPLFVVTQRLVSEGTFLQIGSQVCTLAIDGTLKLRANVPEKFSALIAVDQKASITTASVNEALIGAVTNVHPTVDPKTRTFEIEIQVANPNGQLKPGNFAKAALQIAQRDGSATVPLEAIVGIAGISKLFVFENGKAREVQVTLGTQTNEWVEILQPPLPENAVVITSGHGQLSTGSLVQVRSTSVAADNGSPTRGTQSPSEKLNP